MPSLTHTKSFSSLTKKRDGWTASDHYDLPHGYQLQISTSKHSNGAIMTTALVGHVEHHEGCTYSSFTYVMGVGRPGDGDYYARLRSLPGRATEKSVGAQQESVIADMLPSILDDISCHYAGKKLMEPENVEA